MANTENEGSFFERLGDLGEDRLIIWPNTKFENNSFVLDNIYL